MSVRGLGLGVLLVWFAEVLELALPFWLPRGGAVLPVISAIVLWKGSAGGLCLGGGLLLVDWMARPTCFPAAPLLLPVVALLLTGAAGGHAQGLQRRRLRIPAPLLLPLLAVLLLAAQSASHDTWQAWQDPAVAVAAVLVHVRAALLVLLPVSGVLALLLQLGDELGLRRSAVSG
ncbi:MAG: hypothetical protein ACKO2P_02090 [Planctomycetota bacterium]